MLGQFLFTVMLEINLFCELFQMKPISFLHIKEMSKMITDHPNKYLVLDKTIHAF